MKSDAIISYSRSRLIIIRIFLWSETKHSVLLWTSVQIKFFPRNYVRWYIQLSLVITCPSIRSLYLFRVKIMKNLKIIFWENKCPIGTIQCSLVKLHSHCAMCFEANNADYLYHICSEANWRWSRLRCLCVSFISNLSSKYIFFARLIGIVLSSIWFRMIFF